MAGHRKRRKREAEIRRWLISGLPWSSHSSAQLEKILFNSSGKDLEAQHDETSALWFNVFSCLFSVSLFFSPMDIDYLLHYLLTGFPQVPLVVVQI